MVGEKTAWEIAREAPSLPALPSARENWELESMVFVLPPVISDADFTQFSEHKDFTEIQNLAY